MRHGHPLRQWLRAHVGLDVVRVPVVTPPTTYRHAVRLDYFRRRLADVRDVPGAVVECGVYQGDSLTLLGIAVQLDGPLRALWGFDSFAGLPTPSAHDTTPRAEAGRMARTSEAMVTEKLKMARVTATLVKGFFTDTIDRAPDGIALLHLDVDLYESYRDCLTALRPKMAPGGAILFDEYDDPAWPGATQAIREAGFSPTRDACGKHFVVLPR